MLAVAATTLSSLVTADDVAQGTLYPPIADLRRVSGAIATAVATQARQDGCPGWLPVTTPERPWPRSARLLGASGISSGWPRTRRWSRRTRTFAPDGVPGPEVS